MWKYKYKLKIKIRNQHKIVIKWNFSELCLFYIKSCRQRGAVIVDDLEITDIDIILSPKRSGELTVMLADFKLLLNDYLKELITSPVRSLADVIAFNNKHPQLVRSCSIVIEMNHNQSHFYWLISEQTIFLN